MAPTTATLVREQIVGLIEALTPPTLTPPVPQPFRRYEQARPFADHIENTSAAHVIRLFDLRFTVAGSPPVTNLDIERWRYEFTLAVAYPRVHYKGAQLPVLGIDELIDADQRLIYQVLRDQPTDAVWLLEGDTFETEDVGEARIVRYGALYEIYRDMRS